MSMEIPDDLFFSKEHEWVKLEGDNAYIGITEFAQSELGDIVFVELPSLGKLIEQTEDIGVIESVKTVSNLYSPVSGEVVAINEQVMDIPDIINTSPYEDGWLIKILLSDLNEVDDLMNAQEYQDYLENLDL